MEYRCRLGTPTGEIVEEIHVSDSEARLRHDLEQRGFCVLGVQPRSVLGRVSLPSRMRRRVPTREFLVFNQELATLLKAGMPLVQSLDILRSRVEHPTFRPVLDDVYERVRGGHVAVGRVLRRTATCSRRRTWRRCWRGRRAAASTACCGASWPT